MLNFTTAAGMFDDRLHSVTRRNEDAQEGLQKLMTLGAAARIVLGNTPGVSLSNRFDGSDDPRGAVHIAHYPHSLDRDAAVPDAENTTQIHSAALRISTQHGSTKRRLSVNLTAAIDQNGSGDFGAILRRESYDSNGDTSQDPSREDAAISQHSSSEAMIANLANVLEQHYGPDTASRILKTAAALETNQKFQIEVRRTLQHLGKAYGPGVVVFGQDTIPHIETNDAFEASLRT